MKRKLLKSAFICFAVACQTASFSVSSDAMLWPSDKAMKEYTEFTTIDLNGNEVTEEIFADKDVTMVNVWGTYCTPCVNEMPQLGEISRSMPENMQMIGLVIDIRKEGDTYHELAKQIVEQTQADYTHLIANECFENLLATLEGVPTTYFVDSEGNILGESILGADLEAYEERLTEYAKEYPVDDEESSGESDGEESDE